MTVRDYDISNEDLERALDKTYSLPPKPQPMTIVFRQKDGSKHVYPAGQKRGDAPIIQKPKTKKDQK